MSIVLDKELGINARLTFCCMCGGDGDELVLAGNRNNKRTCLECDTTTYGAMRTDKCSNCGKTNWSEATKMNSYEKVPASQPCNKCKELIEVVKAGGVFYKCSAGCFGVIRKTEYADEVRKAHNIEAPKPCGVEFDAKDCPSVERHNKPEQDTA